MMNTNPSFLRVMCVHLAQLSRLPSPYCRTLGQISRCYWRVPRRIEVLELQSDIVTSVVRVGVRPSLPVEGLSLILGNDLAGGRVTPDPCVTMQPTISYETKEEMSIYPACAVT